MYIITCTGLELKIDVDIMGIITGEVINFAMSGVFCQRFWSQEPIILCSRDLLGWFAAEPVLLQQSLPSQPLQYGQLAQFLLVRRLHSRQIQLQQEYFFIKKPPNAFFIG